MELVERKQMECRLQLRQHGIDLGRSGRHRFPINRGRLLPDHRQTNGPDRALHLRLRNTSRVREFHTKFKGPKNMFRDRRRHKHKTKREHSRRHPFVPCKPAEQRGGEQLLLKSTGRHHKFYGSCPVRWSPNDIDRAAEVGSRSLAYTGLLSCLCLPHAQIERPKMHQDSLQRPRRV